MDAFSRTEYKRWGVGFAELKLTTTTHHNRMREAVLEQCSSISPLLAARISLAVIGHVLYSKGQIPL